MKVEANEIFGPVLTVNAYDDFDEAVARCADSRYGLRMSAIRHLVINYA